MKRYIQSSKVSQRTIDYKKKYIENVVNRISRGLASSTEIATACDMVAWLWKWKVIDREECDQLADLLADAMDKSLL
jgi:hypothetical protein